MKIALVHDWLTGMRGGEKCLEVLCRRFPDAELFTLVHAPGSTSPAIERMSITTSRLQDVPGAVKHYRYFLPLMPAAVDRLKVPSDVDLVVSFSHAVAKGIRPPRGVPHICYCFTPMRYAWHRRDDYFGSDSKTPTALIRNQLLDRICRWDRATSDRVTHYVAISQTVARRIEECYGRTSRIIFPPVDTNFYTPGDTPDDAPASNAREDYYVCVSALVPYKRISLAIEACNRLGRRLIVIGDGPERKKLQRLAGEGVIVAGWRSNEEIRHHLQHARALLFPANEDFGIVPLEAQACATPVIALGLGGATETVLPADSTSPGTGWFFPDQTVDSLCSAIEAFESHTAWFDPQLARQQAERFSLERFERELVDYLHEVVAESRATQRLRKTA